MRFCADHGAAKGTITFIHRADRLEALLAELRARAGEIVVFPLWPGGSRPASRVLVRARKEVAAPTRLPPAWSCTSRTARFTRGRRGGPARRRSLAL